MIATIHSLDRPGWEGGDEAGGRTLRFACHSFQTIDHASSGEWNGSGRGSLKLNMLPGGLKFDNQTTCGVPPSLVCICVVFETFTVSIHCLDICKINYTSQELTGVPEC